MVAVDRIVSQFQPVRVILFGSRARGDSRVDSDIDLLVVLAELPADPWAVTAAMRRAIGAIGIGKDILLTDLARVAARSHLPGTIEELAAREGVVLHEAV